MERGDAATVTPRPQDNPNSWYVRAAVILLDGVLLFLLLNLILYPIMLAQRPRAVWTPIDRWGSATVLKAYPGWRKEDVETLMTETYRLGHEFEFEPFTGFREKAFRGKYVNIDSAGFRVSKDQAPWPPAANAINVFLFGGSTTFGYGLPDDQTIASYLAECGLADDFRRRLAVYNFGRGSYFSTQEMILFHQLVNAGFVPQVAVFIDGINEFDHADGEPRFADGFRRFMDGETRSSSLEDVPVVSAMHWLADRLKKAQSQRTTSHADPAALEGVVHRWLANKRTIQFIAGGYGVRAIFVWQPVPMYKYDLQYDLFYKPGKASGSIVWARQGYALMENLRAQGKLGPNVLWLADTQQDRHENLYVDNFHYNANFSKEIATQICGFLHEPTKGMSECCSTGSAQR